MRKHRTKRPGRVQGWRNANTRLTQDATNSIIELFDGAGEWDDDFAVDYLREQYLSKYCDEQLVPAVTRREAAITKWLATEDRNRDTNTRLTERDPGYNILPRVTWTAFLKFARKIVSSVLGPLDDSIVIGGFSGGASTSRRRTESHPAQKFSDKADATEEALKFIDIIYRESDLLRRYNIFSDVKVVEGAVLFTVPKKTDIDRCACKEPDVNMYLQKGVGNLIRRRLRKFGINLNDQNINRRLSEVGSLTGELATLDLSSASDTITIEAVRSLLPYEWFEYLNDIRSPSVVVDGSTIRTEMFSSMGNGFTFELESLLFYALVRTTLYFEGIPGVVSVYGDDIICPAKGFDSVEWVLREFGFSVNTDKSFHTGPFRESCGGHYHSGRDVTPFYLKRRPTHMTDLIRVCNQLRRWATADPVRKYCSPAMYNKWHQLARYVPRDLWGGYDLAVDTQLVAPVPPTNRLSRLAENRSVPEMGSYVLWHNSTRNRTVDPDQPASDATSTSNKCRKQRVRLGAPSCTALFYEEEVV